MSTKRCRQRYGCNVIVAVVGAGGKNDGSFLSLSLLHTQLITQQVLPGKIQNISMIQLTSIWFHAIQFYAHNFTSFRRLIITYNDFTSYKFTAKSFTSSPLPQFSVVVGASAQKCSFIESNNCFFNTHIIRFTIFSPFNSFQLFERMEIKRTLFNLNCQAFHLCKIKKKFFYSNHELNAICIHF